MDGWRIAAGFDASSGGRPMIHPWNIKFNRNAICTLVGSTTRVRIEAVRVNRFGEVMYDVREIESNEGYPALEASLRSAANAIGIGGGK